MASMGSGPRFRTGMRTVTVAPTVLTGGSDFARDVRALGAEITGVKSLKDAPKNWLKNMVGKPLKGVKMPAVAASEFDDTFDRILMDERVQDVSLEFRQAAG